MVPGGAHINHSLSALFRHRCAALPGQRPGCSGKQCPDEPAPSLRIPLREPRHYYGPVRRRVPRRYSAPRSFCCLARSLSLPPHHGRSVSTRLPLVPHASRRPGSRHLHAGHRLASSTGIRQAHPGTGIEAPVLMPFHSLDASAVVHSRSPSRSPPDGSHAAFSASLTTAVFS